MSKAAKELTLPIPPSTNQLWRASGRRGCFYKSAAYQTWIQHANLVTPRATPLDVPAEIQIEIHGGKGWRASRDLDNTIKAILDLLRERGYIRDDNTQHVTRISTEYISPATPRTGASCRVRVIPSIMAHSPSGETLCRKPKRGDGD